MRKVLNEEDAITRPFLVEYDREIPAPEFTPDLIRYIESRQNGLSARDMAKLEGIEWFVYNKYFNVMLTFDVPGIRESDVEKAAYIKRFSDEPYLALIKRFMNYVPSDFPEDQIGRFNQPSYRLTLANGDQFYPINYNGNFAAWRKRLDDNAKHFDTSIGVFAGGKFVISDGRVVEVVDMDILKLGSGGYPDDF